MRPKQTGATPELRSSDESQGFGITALNEKEDNTILVEAVRWLHGRSAAPHDHQILGELSSNRGAETNVFGDRHDDGPCPQSTSGGLLEAGPRGSVRARRCRDRSMSTHKRIVFMTTEILSKIEVTSSCQQVSQCCRENNVRFTCRS